MSRDSRDGIVTAYGLRNWCFIPGNGKDFSIICLRVWLLFLFTLWYWAWKSWWRNDISRSNTWKL